MGAPKACVELAGRPLIAHALEKIVAAGIEPVVVAKPGSELPPIGCAVIRDDDSALHPAAGILAALRANRGGPVVVVACDMPFVPPEIVAFLAKLAVAIAVPRMGSRLQPLVARYSPTATAALEGAIERAEPLHEAIGALDPRILGPEELARFGEPERILFNVNDRDDLAAAERLMAVAPSR
jgi:molybdopterin-guanine dinucleotide biosynthesis protein A